MFNGDNRAISIGRSYRYHSSVQTKRSRGDSPGFRYQYTAGKTALRTVAWGGTKTKRGRVVMWLQASRLFE